MQNKDSVYYDMLIALRQIIRSTDLHSKKLVKAYGLTGPQLILIQVIANKGEIVIGNLAKEVSLSQATVTNIVERLEHKGFLSRKRTDHDKRRVLVSATDKAHEILKQKPSLLAHGFIEKFDNLEDWEQNMLLSNLQRIACMMTETVSKIEPAFMATPYENAELKDDMIITE